MLGKVAIWVGRQIVCVLAIFGAVVVFILFQAVGWLKGGEKPPVVQAAPGVAPAVVAPAVLLAAPEKPEAAPGCECGSGAPECVGSRGGRYCLRPDGTKKYTGK